MRKRIATALIALGALAGCGGGPLALPLCSDPAPLLGTFDARAPGYIVVFVEGTDAVAETNRLAALYGFTPTDIYEAVGGFAARLSPATVARLRCEPSVLGVDHNSVSIPN